MTFADFIPPGWTAADMFFVLAWAATFVAVVAIWVPLMDRQPSGRRTIAIRQRRTDLLAEAKAPKSRGLGKSGMSFAKRVVQKFTLLGSDQADVAQRKMLQAGFRSKDAVVLFLFMKLAMPVVLGVLSAGLLYGTGLYPVPEITKLAVCIGLTLIGFYLPELYAKNAADKRKLALSKSMPDAMDLLVICVEAGLNLDSALVRVAREIRIGNPELADELELTSVELGFLPDRRDALRNLEIRTDLPSVTALVGTLAQAEKYGTPLAQSLRVLAAEMRTERLMKAEEKAAKLPATLTVPMVIFIMPSLFIVLIGPGILRTLDGLGNL